MDCPACQTSNRSGQKFCGACGRKLEMTCARCGAANPPQYKFCGECGSNLASAGAVILARSGLVARADQKILALLGRREGDVLGKPFSLFVEKHDLVVFFSHLNELHSDQEKATFEITLKHGDGKSVHTMVEGSAESQMTQNPGEVHLSFSEVTDRRETSAQMQYQQDLLALLFSTTDNISAVSRKHLDLAIQDALKNICLFTKADHCFIYDVNRRQRRMEPYCHWSQASISTSGGSDKLQSVPLEMVKRTIVRLRRSQTYVVNDVAQLAPAERYELLAWHKTDLGAMVCPLIYSGKHPVGVIGLAKNKAAEDWSQESVAILKFFGQFVANQRHKPVVTRDAAGRQKAPSGGRATSKKKLRTVIPENVIDISAKKTNSRKPPDIKQEDPARPKSRPAAELKSLPDTTRPMLLEKFTGSQKGSQQPVFQRDDGLILLTCPRCGLQESVSSARFKKLGNAVHVDCPCRKQFTAVLEKRRSYRKSVKLDGYFSLKSNKGPANDPGNLSGAMVIKDLSKTGLRFTSRKANLVNAGDLLFVRFNLDNSNKALIHKPARVISASQNEVGCQFEGSDSYDITLGFYFI